MVFKANCSYKNRMLMRCFLLISLGMKSVLTRYVDNHYADEGT